HELGRRGNRRESERAGTHGDSAGLSAAQHAPCPGTQGTALTISGDRFPYSFGMVVERRPRTSQAARQGGRLTEGDGPQERPDDGPPHRWVWGISGAIDCRVANSVSGTLLR